MKFIRFILVSTSCIGILMMIGGPTHNDINTEIIINISGFILTVISILLLTHFSDNPEE